MAIPHPVVAARDDPFPFTLERVRTSAELRACVTWLAAQTTVCLDCEATDKVPRTAIPLTLQLGSDDGTLVWVVELQRFSELQLRPLWAALKARRVCGHNLKYDYQLLRSHYPSVRFAAIYDTQLAEQLLTTGDYGNKGLWLKEVALKALAHRYLDHDLEKEERASFIGLTPEQAETWAPSEAQLRYAALDVAILPTLVDLQMERLQNEGLLRAAKLRMEALIPLAEVELRGIRIDTTAWRAYLAELEEQKAALQAELEALLTPYELAYREQQYFTAQQERNRWQEAYDRHLELLKAEWEGLPLEGRPGWGKYKNEQLALYRERHPRPPLPKLDLSAINLNSNQQVLRAFQALGLEMTSSDKLARAKALHNPHLAEEQRRVLETYAQYTRVTKYISAFGENILAKIAPETGKLHPTLNINLTDTTRMSAENPNFQNFPAVNEIRHCFLADPGTLVVTADFKSQELVIGAALSQDPVMMADITAGKDLYKQLAMDIFHLASEDAVTKEQRKMCKNALLGIGYGLSAKGMERQHQIPEKVAQKLLDGVRGRYRRFVAWGDEQAALAVTRGYVTTASGARRYFRDKQQPQWQFETQGRNAPVQGSAADIVYRMAARFEAHLVPQGILPVNYVHDEAVVLVPEARAEEARDLIVAEMQAAFNDVLPYETYGMRVGVDCHIDRFWTKD